MTIDLSYIDTLINPVYLSYLDNENRYLIFFGGSGSGKSVFAVQKLIYRILTEQNHRILVIRKVAKTLRESCFKLFALIIDQWGLSEFFNVYKSELKITSEVFNSEIIFTGIDDSEKIKSITDITSVWVEEATELVEDDLDQIDLRIRGITDYYKQIVLTFNPIDKKHWLKKKFFDEKSEDVSTLRTTYLDNNHLDEQYKRVLENRFKNNPVLYDIYVLGMWGNPKRGGEFYSCFNYQDHVKKLGYNPEYPIILSWDFNVLPYSACLICQLVNKKFYIVDEIALESPDNRPINVCRRFKEKYPANNVIGLRVTGDASGKNSSTVVKDGVNNYTQIFHELIEYNPVDRVPTKNPNVFSRGEWINNIFSGDYEDEGIEIIINETCDHFIEDIMNIKKAEDGTKLKKRVKDQKTGQTYEKYGHLSDCLDIATTTFLNNDFHKYKKGGDIKEAIKINRNRSERVY